VTRRAFISVAVGAEAKPRLVVPVRRVINAWAKSTPESLRKFRSSIWPETVRDFARCGIELKGEEVKGEIGRSPGGNPVFAGLERGVINVVVTDYIPMNWDNGRGLPGLTTIFEGYHLCLVALGYAHGHQIPFLSINTCVHELLHALLHDIFHSPPTRFKASRREFEIDWLATRLWLFGEGTVIRESAQRYVRRLRSREAEARQRLKSTPL
jgi:hypothetical protein